MATASFIIDGAVDIAVEVNDDGGTLNFKVTVLKTDGKIGDLRGFFFDVAGEFPGEISVVGGDVTDFDSGRVKNLGNGANMNGARQSSYDVGVEIGTAGIGGDDVRTTQFSVGSGSRDLTLADIIGQTFGVRLTSVGEEGGRRSGSLKIVDDPEIVPEEQCFKFCIDFEKETPGQAPGAQSFLGGDLEVLISGERKGSPVGNDAMIFDADQVPPVSGGDTDLLAGDGNVLIISEDNDPVDPDDAEVGGTLVFNFSKAVNLTKITVIDTEELGSIIAYGANNSQLGTIVLDKLTDGELKVYDLTQFDGVSKLEVVLGGSGAVDDLCFDYCRPAMSGQDDWPA